MSDTPLTDVDYRNINTALGHIAQSRDVIERARRAGLEMDDAAAVLDAYQFKLEALKREFFPSRP